MSNNKVNQTVLLQQIINTQKEQSRALKNLSTNQRKQGEVLFKVENQIKEATEGNLYNNSNSKGNNGRNVPKYMENLSSNNGTKFVPKSEYVPESEEYVPESEQQVPESESEYVRRNLSSNTNSMRNNGTNFVQNNNGQNYKFSGGRKNKKSTKK